MSKKLAIAMFGQKRLSREGGVEIVVKELCTRMAQKGCDVTCYNRAGHHVSGAEYDDAGKTEYEGIRQKSVPTIERRGLAAVSSSAFAALYSAFGKYDVVHIHAEGPAFFAWLPKMFGKRVVVTVHGIDWQREKWQSGLGSKFIHQGEKNAAKYADEVIVLSKGVQDYFKETYGRETHFIPNGVNTTTFHGTIFTLLNHKKCAIYSCSKKLKDLLEWTHKEETMLSLTATYDEFESLITKQHSYELFETIIEKKGRNHKRYI